MTVVEDAGIRWLNVHPDYLVSADEWEIVTLARNWRDGLLPERGGVQDQSAWVAAAVDVVLVTWSKMQAARDARLKEK